MNKIERIDSLLNNCNDFLDTLNANAVWNLNDGINVPDYIDANSSEWRTFVNQINLLDKLIGPYSSIDALKQVVASVTRIDGTAIDDLIVKLNELKTEIEIETVHISSGDLVDNKSQLEILLDEMSSLESEFVTGKKISGMPTPDKTIHKSKTFLLWKNKVINELGNNANQLAKNIVSELNSFNGWNDEEMFNNINAELTVLVEEIKKLGVDSMSSQLQPLSSKEPKIFISHATKDEAYVKEIVGLLEDIGVSEEGIFCSSVAGYGIPGGQNIYDYLRGQFETFNLHVLFVLSENYYSSCACLNEMGAAWVKRNKHTTILLPGFDFDEIKGVLDKETIATKLDDREDTLNIRLSELRDEVITEFNLRKISEHKWERIRNNFINSIRSI